MKKLFSVILLTLALGLGVTLVSCGDDKDEPTPDTHNLESVYENETDTHFMFDIDVEKKTGSIYIYNVVFTIGERVSPAMNIRIDAPCTIDKSGKVFILFGTDIIPFMLRGNTPVPVESMPITNLTCNVDTKKKTYDIYFNCHGGEYKNAGKLQ